ncbi:hypothetical protein [Ralstonia pseudosolanacearum]
MQDNKRMFRGMFLAATALTALAGCGGGGDLENGVTALQASPATASFAGPNTSTCYTGSGGRYFIYGGKAPYIIQNALPAFMTVSTTKVNDVGGSFDVTLLGACMTNGTINITDAMGRLVTVTINDTIGQ